MDPDYCEVCLAVANGGRIRLTETRGILLEELLVERRRKDLISRRQAIILGKSAVVSGLNEGIREIDATLAELGRTQLEKGWRTANEQPQQPDPERAGPFPSTSADQPVG